MESGNEYLPDLNNEKTGEQIVFELKVKISNKTFINRMEDVIKWLTSPSENRVYLKSASTNWHAYKKFAHQFTYDEWKKILYKNVSGSDGIGKYNVIHIVCVCVCLSVCVLFFISQVILWQFCVWVNLENSHLILEWKAEVVTSLERQNSLISSCHDGLSSSIESIASLGHLGMWNMT